MDNGSFLSSNSTIVLESIHVFCFVSTEFEVGLEWVILILRGHNCSKIFVSMVVSEGGEGGSSFYSDHMAVWSPVSSCFSKAAGGGTGVLPLSSGHTIVLESSVQLCL